MRYDRDGDQHYDVISAFIKSIRGSDVDAALHYLARMIEAGEDPRFIARRLVVHASEDVGMADPTALQAARGGGPGRAADRHARGAASSWPRPAIHLATAPKSNAVIAAIDAALADVREGAAGPVPAHLRDGHYAGAQEARQRPADTAIRTTSPEGVVDPAVSAGRPGRPGLLRPHQPRRRTRPRRPGAQTPQSHPRRVTAGSVISYAQQVSERGGSDDRIAGLDAASHGWADRRGL